MDLKGQKKDTNARNAKEDGLSTHQFGMIGAYETRETDQPVTIESGRAPGSVPER
jgi:hypothetical protein